MEHIICFDGGSASNIPPFGNGYGSYRIDDRPIVRLDFKKDMSANVAEIKTGLAALDDLQKTTLGNYSVYITGDSQIALRWIEAAYLRKDKKVSKGATDLFKRTIGELRDMLETNFRIISLKTEWKPRIHSVEIFGH